jgi:hypothetical protein
MYYENTGTVNNPIFAERTESNNPFAAMEVEGVTPSFVDIDNDGDLDAIIGW